MKKGKFSKLIVSLVVVLNTLFTIGVLIVFYKTAVEPTALVTGWFAFTTGELWMLGSIKKAKVKGVVINESVNETETDK